TLTGFHGLHVSFGLLALLIVLGVALVSNFKNGHFPALGAVGYYWHFVDVVWVLVFAIVYLWPLLRRRRSNLLFSACVDLAPTARHQFHSLGQRPRIAKTSSHQR